MANIVTLEQVKSWLQYPNPGEASPNDAALQWVINAADLVIETECDEILPKRFIEQYDGGDYTIFLRHHPVLSVENVQENWGYINYDLDYVEIGSVPPTYSLYAYSIDDYPSAQISRRSAGNVLIPFRPGVANIQIVYTAGEKEVPANVFLAELELIAHWWQNSQLRAVAIAGANVSYDAVAGAAYTRDTESGVQNINIGVPYRILEMIKGHRRTPIIA